MDRIMRSMAHQKAELHGRSAELQKSVRMFFLLQRSWIEIFETIWKPDDIFFKCSLFMKHIVFFFWVEWTLEIIEIYRFQFFLSGPRGKGVSEGTEGTTGRLLSLASCVCVSQLQSSWEKNMPHNLTLTRVYLEGWGGMIPPGCQWKVKLRNRTSLLKMW